MSECTTPAEPAYSTPLRAGGALCSFAIPGLGQILQGLVRNDRARLLKGVLFFLSLNVMFLCGMWLGVGRNVYVPHQAEQAADEGKPSLIFGWQPPPLLNNMVLVRLQYAGQFWIGLAAWPALWNYYVPDEPILDRLYASPGSIGVRHLQPEAWSYLFAPYQPDHDVKDDGTPEPGNPDPQAALLAQLAREWKSLGSELADARERYETARREDQSRVPEVWLSIRRQLRKLHLSKSEEQLNRIQLSPPMGKLWDIAWVYTVIAGVLNILVIYDAWAGPIRLRPQPPSGAGEKKATP